MAATKSSKMEIEDEEEEDVDIELDLKNDDNNNNNNNSSENKTNNTTTTSTTNITTTKKTNQIAPSFELTKPKTKKTKRANLMWVEKYRPSKLEGIISHRNILDTISKLVSLRKLPHLLFYGPPGTGKTTTILAAARQLNGKTWQSMTLELNASDERGINVIRDQIKTFASTQQIFASGFKLVILDEADAMTSSAQFALRRVIEKYTKNTRFCLICNYVNKIIPALQSRCTKFRFAPLERNDIQLRLNEICRIENVNLDKNGSGLTSIINLSNGDMRKCLNILQACHTGYPVVNELNVHLTTGAPLPSDIHVILNLLLNKDFDVAYDEILKIQKSKGLALTDIVQSLHHIIIRLKFDNNILCHIFAQLSDLEHRLTVATDEQIQLASLVGIFQIVRHKAFAQSQQRKNQQQQQR